MPGTRFRTRLPVAIATVAVLASACTDQTARFCSAYEHDEPLESLFAAIDDGDAESIDEALADLDELRDKAPAEIAEDVDVVLDTFADTVRVATQAEDPNGVMVDLEDLNTALAGVTVHGQRIEEFVAENCRPTDS